MEVGPSYISYYMYIVYCILYIFFYAFTIIYKGKDGIDLLKRLLWEAVDHLSSPVIDQKKRNEKPSEKQVLSIRYILCIKDYLYMKIFICSTFFFFFFFLFICQKFLLDIASEGGVLLCEIGDCRLELLKGILVYL
jgi:hypothetical protein